MKLHLGCGSIKLGGYVNIDMYEEKPGIVDRVFDLNTPLDYEENSIEEIQAFHLFEHLSFANIEAVVKSWFKVLKPQGKLIMEMPDFDEVVKWYLENPNDNSVIASIFGNQNHLGQYHHWGWNKTRLKMLLEGVGFKEVVFKDPIDYHASLEPCLRVEATK